MEQSAPKLVPFLSKMRKKGKISEAEYISLSQKAFNHDQDLLIKFAKYLAAKEELQIKLISSAGSNSSDSLDAHTARLSIGSHAISDTETTAFVPQEPAQSTQQDTSDWICGYNPSLKEQPFTMHSTHLLPHAGVVCSARFSSDGALLATALNRAINVYNSESGQLQKVLRDPATDKSDGLAYLRSVCFSPDGQKVIAAENRSVKIWDYHSSRLLRTLPHDLDVYSVDVTTDGRAIAAGDGDRKLKLWQLNSGECLHVLGDDCRDAITSVAFTPDGRHVAASSLDRVVRLYDAESGKLQGRFDGHADSVYSVAVSPDGFTLASGSLDKTARLWDLRSPTSTTVLTGHRDFVLSVTFADCYLLSGSKDRSVFFWDLRSTMHVAMLQGHKNSVLSVAATHGIRCIATASGDSTARLWHLTL